MESPVTPTTGWHCQPPSALVDRDCEIATRGRRQRGCVPALHLQNHPNPDKLQSPLTKW